MWFNLHILNIDAGNKQKKDSGPLLTLVRKNNLLNRTELMSRGSMEVPNPAVIGQITATQSFIGNKITSTHHGFFSKSVKIPWVLALYNFGWQKLPI